MKKHLSPAVLLFCLVLLFGCGKPKVQKPPQTDAVSSASLTEQTYQYNENVPPDGEFATEVIDDGIRYFWGGFSIDMEYSFEPETLSDGSICLSNGFLRLLISHTDDYDREMFTAYGYDMAQVDLEEYGSILIDANGLSKDCMFYDACDNLCLRYTTPASDAEEYQVLAVVKKAPNGDFWLLQFLGTESVLEAYMVYIPQWASTVTFYSN
ncbi:MAG: hypothetical protein MJ085_06415 [Clostridia bacterium]|nr:hypothetical protein [Clostridia bacterium]